MWTLIKCAKEGDVWSAHKEFLLDSDSEISTEPTNYQPIAPGSIAYTHGLAKIWMKNADNTWSLIPDGGGASNVDDVQINGTSIVSNKIANIPLMANGVTGVAAVSTPDGSGIEIVDGQLKAIHATNSQITNRNNSRRHISPQNIDFAVKTAMCDGVGTAWTAEEKTAAMDRIGCVKDVQINGASIISEGAANIPLVGNELTNGGLVKLSTARASGISVPYSGAYARLYPANNVDIDNRAAISTSTAPIMSSNLVYAVNSVLCSTNTSETLTTEQQTAAKSRLGISEKFKKIAEHTVTEQETSSLNIAIEEVPKSEIIILLQNSNGAGGNNYAYLQHDDTTIMQALYFDSTTSMSMLRITALNDDFITGFSFSTSNGFSSQIKGGVFSQGDIRTLNKITFRSNGASASIGVETIIRIFIK